jgi:hypothetical protein
MTLFKKTMMTLMISGALCSNTSFAVDDADVTGAGAALVRMPTSVITPINVDYSEPQVFNTLGLEKQSNGSYRFTVNAQTFYEWMRTINTSKDDTATDIVSFLNYVYTNAIKIHGNKTYKLLETMQNTEEPLVIENLFLHRKDSEISKSSSRAKSIVGISKHFPLLSEAEKNMQKWANSPYGDEKVFALRGGPSHSAREILKNPEMAEILKYEANYDDKFKYVGKKRTKELSKYTPDIKIGRRQYLIKQMGLHNLGLDLSDPNLYKLAKQRKIDRDTIERLSEENQRLQAELNALRSAPTTHPTS